MPNILTLIGLRSKAQLVFAVFDWARTDLYSASSFRDEEYWGVVGRGGEWEEEGRGLGGGGGHVLNKTEIEYVTAIWYFTLNSKGLILTKTKFINLQVKV